MSIPIKIFLINIVLAILSTILIVEGRFDNEFVGIFGLVGIFGGVVDLIIGLLLLFAKDKRYAQGFLLSGGVLFLFGLFCCSSLR